MKRKTKRTLFRIIISALLLSAAIIADRLGFIPSAIIVGGVDLLLLSLYIIPYAVIGYDILARAIRNLLNGQVFDENFLMSIATLGAIAIGEYSEAVFVMLFYQVGELFQSIAVGKSRSSIRSLLSIRPDTAFVMNEEGDLLEKPCESICVGDVICVKAGGRVPLDGVIIEGKTSLNTSALTGESIPRDAEAGDEALSGCINESGFIKIQVTRHFEESTVSKILKLVESAAENKSASESFITKFARVYTPAVVIAAAIMAVIPPIFLGIGDASVWKECVYRAMTFLVISCPCALVISIPLSYFGGIGAASSKGILVKGSNYLDALSSCDTVVFDKTGTLTEGIFEVSKTEPADDVSHLELLSLAAAAEKYSTHPIAQSIKKNFAYASCAETADVKNIEELSGRGVRATYDQKTLLVGNARLMLENGMSIDGDTEATPAIHLALGEKYLGSISFSDRIKMGAAENLALLRKAGIKRIVMLTGDRESEASRISKELKIDEYLSELLPADKVVAFERLLPATKSKKKSSMRGGKVVFVGDGINDAPVLARADIGVAMGAMGSDSAIEAADVVLMDDDLRKISDVILLSRRTRKIVIENIVFALGVKGAVLALGALGILGLNAAVFADVGVAVLAILNAMRNLKK